MADATQSWTMGDHQLRDVEIAGDLDGDGVREAVFGLPYSLSAGWSDARVVLSPIDRGGDVDDAEDVLVDTRGVGAGADVGWVGDLDGAGMGGLLVRASRADEAGEKWAWLVSGPVSGVRSLDDAQATFHTGESVVVDGFGSAASPGDLDGDGLDDVAVGVPGMIDERGDGRVYVLFGPVEGDVTLTDADAILSGSGGFGYGSGLLGADFDDDGGAELVVLGYYEGHASLFGMEDLATDEPYARVGAWRPAAAVAGDPNGDGHLDLLTGGTSPTGARSAELCLGPFSGYASCTVRFRPEWYEDGVGASLAGPGDWDGVDDLLIGDPSPWTAAGELYMVSGRGM